MHMNMLEQNWFTQTTGGRKTKTPVGTPKHQTFFANTFTLETLCKQCLERIAVSRSLQHSQNQHAEMLLISMKYYKSRVSRTTPNSASAFLAEQSPNKDQRSSFLGLFLTLPSPLWFQKYECSWNTVNVYAHAENINFQGRVCKWSKVGPFHKPTALKRRTRFSRKCGKMKYSFRGGIFSK